MWGGIQFRVAAATQVRCAGTIFIAAGFAIGGGAANAVPLPEGCDSPPSSRSLVPTPAIARPTLPAPTSSPTPAESNTQVPRRACVPTTMSQTEQALRFP